jgi:PAT family beta-lactamase induction signal transducer AmpG
VNQTTPAPSLLRAIFNRRMLVCVFTGFASGMPLYLLLNLVPAWLKSGNVPLTLIGLFALAQFPFTWKFLWAPLLDRYSIVPWMGRRRSWMFVAQIGLIAAVAWLGQVDISGAGFPWQAFALAAVIAFLSATLDIALDAFRREILPDEELGLGNAIHVNAYRVASLVPGSLSLILADKLPWGEVFAITAAFMLPGLAMSLLVKEPAVAKNAPRTLRAAVVEPFVEFFGRHGLKSALLVLAFIFLYKLGDSLCTALATPFYLDVGFSMTEIGIVAKNAGLWASVLGGILGGIWMIRLGINRALWLFAIPQAVSILGFAALAWMGPPSVMPKEYAGLPPEMFVEAVTRDVLATACANKTMLADNEKNARTLIDNSVRRYVNFGRMAGQTLHSGSDGASVEAQKDLQKKFPDLFHAFLIQDQAATVFQHCDWQVDVLSSRIHPETQEVTVSTMMRRSGEQAIAVDYLLAQEKAREPQSWRKLWNTFRSAQNSDADAPAQPPLEAPQKQTWKVSDITVDGQSLTGHYRALFAEKQRDTGMEGLTAWMKGQIKTDFGALLMLALVVGFEALGVGLGSAALIAFMARTTHPAYIATQFALFSSLTAVPRTFINASAGWLVEGMGGWLGFFWLCFALAIPGMLLLFKVAPWNEKKPPAPSGDA